LQIYDEASGQRVNKEKSSIFSSHVLLMFIGLRSRQI
jgi:hypothetical protein